MKTSKAGRAFIGQKEGLRLRAYRDVVGVWTIGFGHTSAAGNPPVVPGLVITREEADAIFARDLGQYEQAVMAGVGPGVRIEQHQFDAMVSLCYNIGTTAFRGSSVARLFRAGNHRGAANAFRLWNKADGRVIGGLVTRRAAERQMFLGVAQASMLSMIDLWLLWDLARALVDRLRP